MARILSLTVAAIALLLACEGGDSVDVPTPTVPLPTELSLLAEGNGGGLDSATVARVLNAPNPFPDVVATVSGQDISGTALARKMEILRINYEDAASSVPDEGQLITEALDLLIQNELLAQEAEERGLWPTQEEVVAQAQMMKEIILELSPTSPQREAAETLLREQGFDISGLDSDPAILREIERALGIARITSDVEASPPPGQSLDIDAVRAAIKELGDSLRSDAEISIYVSATAE
jgi:hypothetical protein